MGYSRYRTVTLSIILLMAASYGICYIDALADSNFLGCIHSGDSVCTMGDNDCCLTEMGEARSEAAAAIPLRPSRLRC